VPLAALALARSHPGPQGHNRNHVSVLCVAEPNDNTIIERRIGGKMDDRTFVAVEIDDLIANL
jgi:hypothetical protein